MKEDAKKLLHEVHLFPKALLFVNRNMNLVRSVNKKCGSVVNRINVMARFAAQGANVRMDLLERTEIAYNQTRRFDGFWFETRLLIYSLMYKLVTLWMKMRGKRGFEDYLDMKQKEAMSTMYGQYGFRMPDEKTFDA
jgi:aarF domain-containing kinase